MTQNISFRAYEMSMKTNLLCRMYFFMKNYIFYLIHIYILFFKIIFIFIQLQLSAFSHFYRDTIDMQHYISCKYKDNDSISVCIVK